MVKSLNRLRVGLSEIDHDSDVKKQFNKKNCLLIKKNDPDSAVKAAALSLFKKSDRKKIGAMHVEDFLKILREAGLVDSEGQHSARLMLDLIDIDRSTMIHESELVAFAVRYATSQTRSISISFPPRSIHIEAGLVDPEGQHFARLMLDLIDIDRSTMIHESELVAFAVVGTSIDTIRHKLLKFFAFVD
jgi:hypothetical protein